MKDTFEFDLASLQDILNHGFDLGFRSVHGCVPEVTVGSEVLAAIRAGYFGRVDSVVRPGEFGATPFAVERD